MTTEQRLLDNIEDAEAAYKRYTHALWGGASIFGLGVLTAFGSTAVALIFPWSSNYWIPFGMGIFALLFIVSGGFLFIGTFVEESDDIHSALNKARREFRDYVTKESGTR